MRNTITRAACAFALTVPLLVAVGSPAGAWDGPAENDCNAPYGAITKRPAPNRDCVGIDFHDGDYPGQHHNHNGGQWYGPNQP